MSMETKMIKVSKNISTLQKILNYFRVRTEVPNPAAGSLISSGKWSNSLYRVHFGLAKSNRDINRNNDQYPHYDEIGHSDSIVSIEMYNLIRSVVFARQAEYYVQVDEGRVDEVTDLVIAVLEGSMTLYSMLVALWRTQTGYLFKDEDKVYLGPVFFNHEAKGASQADWNITANNSFMEEIAQTSLNTQRKIQNSNELWGCYSIGNEAWANMVSEILSVCYLPANMRWMAEHLFGTVFIDPTQTYVFSSVTLFPDSDITNYTYNSADDKWSNDSSAGCLSGYDSPDAYDGAVNVDNTGNFNDFVTYYSKWVETIAEIFNRYPFMDKVLADLKFNNGSNFDFTRDIKHNSVYFVVTENISDFIQSTALPVANSQVPDITDPVSTVLQVLPFSVRDQEEVHYGHTLEYKDEVEISLDYSIEYFLKGKVYVCRFAYFGFGQNNPVGYYRYQFLENRILSNFSNTSYNLSLMYLNADLNDYGAIETLHNLEMNNVPVSGQGSSAVIITPSVRCYYNAAENIGNYMFRAYDTFIAPDCQKCK